MRIFLVDRGKTYSYDELLANINSSASYCPLFKGAELFAYFCNLTKAVACGKPLVLLDADINACEIAGVAEEDINKSEPIPLQQYDSADALIEAIKKSCSEITIFTSGTTGQPKKVVHTISTLTRSVREGERYKDQVWGYAYNPTHMAGLQVFFQAFFNANSIINIFNQSRTEVYKALEDYSITHLSATPTFYRLLLPVEKSFPLVQRVTLGGEKSNQQLYDNISKIFPNAKLNNVYASTEAGSLFAAKGDCFQIPEALKDSFKVEEGELLIHKSLLGYSEGFQFVGEYYCSGDIIEWVNEKEGLFRFLNRKNELINVGGYKVNPSETESAILAIEGVKQARVFGKANAVLGNVLCADVQLEEGSELTELIIRSRLKESLQDFKIPRRIKFVESITMTRTGKMQRV